MLDERLLNALFHRSTIAYVCKNETNFQTKLNVTLHMGKQLTVHLKQTQQT